ncbi:MAG: alpha/beta hydrolase [Defluviitaleaceae bacterium]|nr:alpha/beta hydrolase [Defluviitaleaceae bacterium]
MAVGLIVVLALIFSALFFFFIVQYMHLSHALNDAEDWLEQFETEQALLSHGRTVFVDYGSNKGVPILSIHGDFGGHDQGFRSVEGMADDFRIIAPSRFGYLGSYAPADPSPKNQAETYLELLDKLDIREVFVFAHSSGIASAIRFASEFTDRIKGVIFVSPAPYQYPPSSLLTNRAMWLLSPFVPLLYGFPSELARNMLPLNRRRQGIMIDAKFATTDANPIYLEIPTLILQTEKHPQNHRFPRGEFVTFETFAVHEEEIEWLIREFIGKNT